MASTSGTSTGKKPEGWTKADKFQLLQTFRKVGSNVKLIKEYFPNKTEAEIQDAVGHFKGIAYARLAASTPTVSEKEHEDKAPLMKLTEWAKLISNTHGSDNIQTETADALRLIAEYEDRPDPVDTGNIDFKKAYLMLADALEGKPLQGDKDIEAVLAHCMAETEESARDLLKGQPDLKKLIESLANPDTDDSLRFSRPTENDELAVLRDLITKTNYNPLNISEANLKFAMNSAKFAEEEEEEDEEEE